MVLVSDHSFGVKAPPSFTSINGMGRRGDIGVLDLQLREMCRLDLIHLSLCICVSVSYPPLNPH